MNAPLSRYLTQFSPAPFKAAAAIPTPFEPKISLTAAELDEQLVAAGAAARSEIEARWTLQTETWQAEKDAAVAEAVAAARAEWTASQSDRLAAGVNGAISELRDLLAAGLVRALRPMISETLRARVIKELREAIDKLLSDPKGPTLSVRGPSDLIDSLRQQCGTVAIDWVVADGCEVTILAGASRIETCLSAALADLSELDG